MCYSRDSFALKERMNVWFFDPHAGNILRSGTVNRVFSYGPEIQVGGNSFIYHRNAVWVDKEKAAKNGPAYDIYPKGRSDHDVIMAIS